MTRSYKDFRARGFSVRADAYNRRETGQPMTSEEKLARDQDIERKSREDLSSLLELRDILDELDTIQRLFDEQEKTVDAIIEHFRPTPLSPPLSTFSEQMTAPSTLFEENAQVQPPAGLKYLEDPKKSIEDYNKRISEMVKNAEKAQTAVSSSG